MKDASFFDDLKEEEVKQFVHYVTKYLEMAPPELVSEADKKTLAATMKADAGLTGVKNAYK